MRPTDARVAALYDADNPDGPDHDFYRQLVDRLSPDVVIDLGCGTGILTVTLAGVDRRIIGIDPDSGMLDVARRRPESGNIEWIDGDSRKIGDAGADVVLMTGNVAQHIGPDDWHRTLSDIAGGLRRGGTLAFETRNPAVGAWQHWSSAKGSMIRETADGRLTEWMDATEPDARGIVTISAHNLFEGDPEEVVIVQPLVFRGLGQILADLDVAGFEVDCVSGGWRGETLSDQSPLFVVTATNRG